MVVEIPKETPSNWLPMGSFGEDLRAERLSRGIALEDITEITKISQRHLVALEQDRFRLLPGGILSKGIVRGYVGAVGLDVQDWTDRFVEGPQRPRVWRSSLIRAGKSSPPTWAACACNSAKPRRCGCAGPEPLCLMVAAVVAGFLTVRYFGSAPDGGARCFRCRAFRPKPTPSIVHSIGLLQALRIPLQRSLSDAGSSAFNELQNRVRTGPSYPPLGAGFLPFAGSLLP